MYHVYLLRQIFLDEAHILSRGGVGDVLYFHLSLIKFYPLHEGYLQSMLHCVVNHDWSWMLFVQDTN